MGARRQSWPFVAAAVSSIVLALPAVAQTSSCMLGATTTNASVAWYNGLKEAAQIQAVEDYQNLLSPNLTIAEAKLKTVFKTPTYVVSSRLKTVPSIRDKLTRKNYQCFSDMVDVIGLRVIVPDYAALPWVDQLVRQHFDVTKAEVLLSASPSAPYRAVHYDLQISGAPAELQIHTRRNSLIAALSHPLVYKGPYKDNADVKDYLNSVGYAVFQLDSGLSASLPSTPSGLPSLANSCLADLVQKLGQVSMTGAFGLTVTCGPIPPPSTLLPLLINADMWDVLDLIGDVRGDVPLGGLR